MKSLVTCFILIFSGGGVAADIGYYQEVNKEAENKFSDPEKNFNDVLKTLLERHVDKQLSKEDLYRAATAGMLAALNPAEGDWNKLIDPHEFREMQIDFSGKVAGIGVELKFDEVTGNALVQRFIPGAAAEKSGVKVDDQILAVDGKKFKNKPFREMVASIRGEAGSSVAIKILREDQILTINVRREIVSWTPVAYEEYSNAKIGMLSLGLFNEQTPKLVESTLKKAQQDKLEHFIIDLRDNSGGSFDAALKTAELFLESGSVIVQTKNREGKFETFKGGKAVLKASLPVTILTSAETASGAELFTAALKENRRARIVGEKTFGKWNVQSLETLSNKYAYKFTVKEFLSPKGNSYQGHGIKPDVEVSLPKEVSIRQLKNKYPLEQRSEYDPQLRAALELGKAG